MARPSLAPAPAALTLVLLLCANGTLAFIADRRGAPAIGPGLGPADAPAAKPAPEPTTVLTSASNGTDGLGTLTCMRQSAYLDSYGSLLPDYSSLGRITVAGDASDVIPSSQGGSSLPNITDVAAWATQRFRAAGMANSSRMVPGLAGFGGAVDWVDALGIRHVRLLQFVECNGTRDYVFDNGAATVHLKNGSTAFLVTGSFQPIRVPACDGPAPNTTLVAAASARPQLTLSAERKPRLSKAEGTAAALRAALDAAPGLASDATAKILAAAASPEDAAALAAAGAAPETREGILCTTETCDIAFAQTVFLPPTPTSGPQELHVYVSATDGSLLHRADRLQTQGVSAQYTQANGGGIGLYTGHPPGARAPLRTSGNPPFKGSKSYVMVDYKWGFATADAKGTFSTSTAPDFYDQDNVWGDGTSKSRATVAVDAHWGMATTLDYYYATHNLNSIDGNGAKLASYVHLGKGYNNAYYSSNAMYYGDGSLKPQYWFTKCINSSSYDLPPLVTLDVASHELTHGVTAHSSSLNYRASSGGINEAMSDIMAECVVEYAYHTNQTSQGATFLLGAALYGLGCPPNTGIHGFFRSMINPPADGGYSWGCWDPRMDRTDSRKVDPYPSDRYCEVEVHTSSGVANRAFWLVTRGLSTACNKGDKPQALGFDKACKVFFRANTAYMTKTSDFYELRATTQIATADLYGAGSPEVQAVQAAWDIVGAPRAPYPNPDAPPCDPFFATNPAAC